MRNLKKFLALVLAMMMTLSLMVTVNAAEKTFNDSESVTKEFQEGVKVLSGLGVIKGVTDDAFAPDHDVTRAQMAAFIYRIVTGDVTDSRVDNFAGYTKFSDVDPNAWYAGYVGFCENGEYIKGYGNGEFGPNKKVTGYQALAMILRAMGYNEPGQNFTGSGWQTRAATTAESRNLLIQVNQSNYAGGLSKNATRELIAELVFEGILQTRVQWTAAYGYQTYDHANNNSVWGDDNGDNRDAYSVYAPLGWKNFELGITDWKEIDEWGNPGYEWTSKNSVIATIKAEPRQTYTTTKHECDIAHDFDIKGEQLFTLYVNGKTPVTDTYRVVATDTVTKVGGEGRLTKVYMGYPRNWTPSVKGVTSSWPVFKGDTCGPTVTMMDTMLVKVVSATPSVLDKADHVITPAKLTVNVFSVNSTNNATSTDATNVAEPVTISKGKTDATNWEYNRGDVLLINACTVANAKTARGTQDAKEKAAYETDVLIANNKLVEDETVFILGAPPTDRVGKQTLIYWNQGKHQIDGDDEIDALTFDLDEAKTNINTTYKWYFDKYGNVIGAEEVDAIGYGVIENIYAAFEQGETNTTGTAKAVATVRMANGSTQTVTIDRFLVKGTPDSTDTAGTAGTTGKKMEDLLVTTGAKGAIELWPVYDTVANEPLKAENLPGSLTIPKTNSNTQGFVYMAPATVSNMNSHKHSSAFDKHGILLDNLFHFVTAANDQVVAIEVSGSPTAPATNTGVFADNYSADNTAGRISKSLARVTTDTGVAVAWLDNETKIMVRNATNETIACYDGVDALPGDVIIEATATGHFMKEIDWTDYDNDGRAEVIYVTGTIDGTMTYNLFFHDPLVDSGRWNGEEGILSGYLNGVATDVTFKGAAGYAMFDKIRTATTYTGRLWALKITNGVVEDVMLAKNESSGSNDDEKLLTDNDSSADANDALSGVVLKLFSATAAEDDAVSTSHANVSFNGSTGSFLVGSMNSKYGNPYSGTTEAVYYKDLADGTASGNSTYTLAYTRIDTLRGSITVNGTSSTGTAVTNDIYYLNPNTKVIGNLAYLNEYANSDVTIVYESTTTGGKAILEVYVTTDPNVTPSSETPAVVPLEGANLIYSNNGTDLLLKIKNLKNVAIYTTGGLSPDGWGTGDQGPDGVLWFPIGSISTAGTAVNLTIRDSKNMPVYTENISTTGTTGQVDFAYITLKNMPNSNKGLQTANFTAGTYSFEIVNTLTGVTYSSGSFTIGIPD